MEMKRDSAACEPGKRPIDLVTSTATSELLAMASCGDGLDSRGILGTTAAGKVAKPVMPARKRPPGGDKQCEEERGIISATMRADGAGGENRRRGNESMLFFSRSVVKRAERLEFQSSIEACSP